MRRYALKLIFAYDSYLRTEGLVAGESVLVFDLTGAGKEHEEMMRELYREQKLTLARPFKALVADGGILEQELLGEGAITVEHNDDDPAIGKLPAAPPRRFDPFSHD